MVELSEKIRATNKKLAATITKLDKLKSEKQNKLKNILLKIITFGYYNINFKINYQNNLVNNYRQEIKFLESQLPVITKKKADIENNSKQDINNSYYQESLKNTTNIVRKRHLN